MTRLALFSVAIAMTACSADSNVRGLATDDGSEASSGMPSEGGQGNGEAGTLTAGEWRDIEDWQLWNDLLIDQSSPLYGIPESWGFEFTERIPVQVNDNESPVGDLALTLLDADQQVLWRARTDNDGHAELFAGMFGITGPQPYSIEVDNGLDIINIPDVTPDPWNDLVIEVPGIATIPSLDLMFVIDTTGSMGDELSYLQVELADVIDEVHLQTLKELDLRISVNFYRDHGDDYVLRSFPFTRNGDDALASLAAQGSNGGGDWPEAVDEALDDAVFGHEWRANATSRLVFLVLDAPPHNGQSSVNRLHNAVQGAAEKGIRIIPLAGSGVDKPTEALLRSMDIATGATYTFLTDHSGIGNDHIEPTVGQYEVEFLNDLLVRLTVESVQ